MEHGAYHDGKFQNLKFSSEGQDASVGVLEPGKYTFTTEQEETVTCLTGEITIDEKTIRPGEKITTPENTEFTISTDTCSSYICIYN